MKQKIDMEKLISLAHSLSNVEAMIVEDDIRANEKLSNSLNNYFKAMYSAYNGEEALNIYRKRKPQVVFIDITMPGMSGLEVAEKIRKNQKDQIIIFISASDQPKHLAKAIELGALDFISKPCNMHRLQGILEKIVEQKENMRYQTSLVTTVLQDERMQRIAQKENTTKSAIAFRAIEKYLDELDKESEVL
ncbi:MAG: response regulator [Campylobacterota bacterium]|nr:response regulator [Campylobacterota bacterium]